MHCVVCRSASPGTLAVRGGMLVQQCLACGQLFVDPQPSDEQLAAIYTAGYFLDSGADDRQGADGKRKTAVLYLDLLEEYAGTKRGKLLDIGCGNGEFLVEAAERGFDVTGIDVSGHAVERANAALGREAARSSTIEGADLPDRHFDVVVCADVIEHARDPIELLANAHRVLKTDGVLLVVTPATDSWAARLLRGNWFEFKTEHLHYFSRPTLENALHRTGFRSIEVSPAMRVMTLDYIQRHFRRFPVRGWTALVNFLLAVTPSRLRTATMRLPTSSVIAFARAQEKRRQPLLSVVVPVYNEKRTVKTLLDALIEKEVDGFDKEVILVEDNSDDGSREEVLRFESAPGVSIILQDRPRGKGFAVRQALLRATGDFVIIQDADLEYSLDDYEALLEPLRMYRRAFVLGSRHNGSSRIRVFTDELLLALTFNAGHALLTTLFNLLYSQTLRDPWTMYKVFRRDCLHRLHLECNRFDFDVELVAKLIRKGYEPAEIAVKYRSRSFAEGKKIRILRDPWTWVRACVKYSLVSPYERRRVSR